MKVCKVLVEIQNRIILIILSWISTFLVAYNNKKQLLFLTIYFNNRIYLDKNFYFITTDITDLLTSYLTLSYFLTNQLVLIYALYSIRTFLAPGLYDFEYTKIRSKLRITLLIIFFCFLFTNQGILPTFWSFFNNYTKANNNVPIYFEAKINEYVDLYIFIYYTSAVICISYSILYYVINFYEYNFNFLKSAKKLMILACFIVSTVLTPPDIASQIAFGLLLIIMNEILTFIVIFKIEHKNYK